MNSQLARMRSIAGRLVCSIALLYFMVIIASMVSDAQANAMGRSFHNSSISQSDQTNKPTRAEQFQQRRENFATGRQLLLNKGIPFEPEELLRDGWPKKLKDVLNTMPGMHEVRRETAPLKGAYIADTLYLPETSHLTGDTVILVNQLVFEGKNPVIKGPYALNVYPSQPMVVLGTTLAEVLRKKSGVMNVKYSQQPSLPTFSMIQDSVQIESRNITFDTSGPEPRISKTQTKPKVGLQTVSWNQLIPISLQDQDHSGNTGQTGISGYSPNPGSNGQSPARAADGTCSGNVNGENGLPGGNADNGSNAGPGGQGGQGGNAGNIDAYIADGNTNYYTFLAKGGSGGMGGYGGTGGNGGNGGKGGDGGNGASCGCLLGDGGNAGHGGDGANGGTGGTGGAGGRITVSLPYDSPGANSNATGGLGGRGGDPGENGVGGTPGNPGNPGIGATGCSSTAPNGSTNTGGSPKGSGTPGSPGAWGAAGTNGPEPVITWRQAPGGGGGGGCGNQGGGGDLLIDDGTGGCSPIILDVDGRGYSLTSLADGVDFDMNGIGTKEHLSWTSAGSTNAFLVLDRNSNGLIDNGGELFGNYTRLSDGTFASNGWVALAEFDKPERGGNGDGVIDRHDRVYQFLRLWQDNNHNGISEREEGRSLESLGVDTIHLDYKAERRRDRYGNLFRFRALVEGHDPMTGRSYRRFAFDVFLVGGS